MTHISYELATVQGSDHSVGDIYFKCNWFRIMTRLPPSYHTGCTYGLSSLGQPTIFVVL